MRYLFLVLCLTMVACAASVEPDSIATSTQELKSCAKILPRCTYALCPTAGPFLNPDDFGKDLVHRFLPGTHKNPADPHCPAPASERYSQCTNDNFRSPPGGNDIISQTADYQYLWYSGVVTPAEVGYVEIADRSLKDTIGFFPFANVWSIDYISMRVAVSTANTQGFTLEAENSSATATVSTVTGNWPNGIMLEWMMLTDPTTGAPWTKARLQDWRGWLIENANDIDANHLGMFVHSMTEQVGFQYNGSVCP